MLRPHSLGGPVTYVMVSGQSMEPTFHGGDLAVVRAKQTYTSGDIVAFRVPKGEPGEGAIVIHRIVGGSADGGFLVQGDNKRLPDPWRPKGEDIIGEMWFHVPGAGRVLAFLRAPLPLATIAAQLAIFVTLGIGEGSKRQSHGGRTAPSITRKT